MQRRMLAGVIAAAWIMGCPARGGRADESVVRWIGDVNFVWTADRDGDTNWNPLGSTDGTLPEANDVARFDGTAPGTRLPTVDDFRFSGRARDPMHFACRTIELPARVSLRRLDFYDVAAGLAQNKRLRVHGPGVLVLQGDAGGLALDVTWQDTSDQSVTVGADVLVGGDVRIRRRAVSHATGKPVLRNRNCLHLESTIGESVAGCRVEFDNENDLDRGNPNHYPVLTVGGSNTYSGGTILNGNVVMASTNAFGSGRTVDVATRRNTTLDVAFGTGAFSGGTHSLDYDFRLPRNESTQRTFRIRSRDCGHLVLGGSFSGGDPGDVVEFLPGTISQGNRVITLAGNNTHEARTVISPQGLLRLAGSMANANITVGQTCTFAGDPSSPGVITFNVSDHACDRIVLAGQSEPNRPGALLDARNLRIRFQAHGPLGRDSYVLVDYSRQGTDFIGSDNPDTDGTFAQARDVPDGYELVHHRLSKRVLLSRK